MQIGIPVAIRRIDPGGSDRMRRTIMYMKPLTNARRTIGRDRKWRNGDPGAEFPEQNAIINAQYAFPARRHYRRRRKRLMRRLFWQIIGMPARAAITKMAKQRMCRWRTRRPWPAAPPAPACQRPASSLRSRLYEAWPGGEAGAGM